MPRHAVVVGGGLIGLAAAWRMAEAGVTASVVDPAPASGASHAAAGMLAPATELQYGEEALLRLTLAAADRYPSFVAELEERSGQPTGYLSAGTLAVALDADDRAALDDLHAFQTRCGLSVAELTGRECRQLEPMLAPSVRGGLLVEDDRSIDNRRLAAALLTALDRSGVRLVRQPATRIQLDRGRVAGVRLGDGTELAADTVVLAAGCWTSSLAGLPASAMPPVRPVKGQILRLRMPPQPPVLLSRPVRGTVRGGHVYLVPRADGELVVGATVEEQGFDTRVTAGGVYELLRDAHELVPGVTELELVEARAGLRPGSPDNAPIIGPASVPGLILATGHYRSGVLLAPITADAVAGLIVDGVVPEVVRPFSPSRFSPPETQEVNA
jgi:glycine oxidase